MAHAGKVLLTIGTKRLGDYCEVKGLLPREQCGFRPRRSTLDMMFAMRKLQDYGRKARVLLCLCFIDLQKAYDSVDRSLLRLITVIREFHDGIRACIRNDNGNCSEEFNVEQ